MRFFGLHILSPSGLDRRLRAEVKHWRETRFEPNLATRDKTIAARDEAIQDLEARLQEANRAAAQRPAQRPKLEATIEDGKKGRWRYKIRRDDGKIISLPPARGLATWDEAAEFVQLLSDAEITVIDGKGTAASPETPIFSSKEASKPWLRQLYQGKVRLALLKYTRAKGWCLGGGAVEDFKKCGYEGLNDAAHAAAGYLKTLEKPSEEEPHD